MKDTCTENLKPVNRVKAAYEILQDKLNASKKTIEAQAREIEKHKTHIAELSSRVGKFKTSRTRWNKAEKRLQKRISEKQQKIERLKDAVYRIDRIAMTPPRDRAILKIISELKE